MSQTYNMNIPYTNSMQTIRMSAPYSGLQKEHLKQICFHPSCRKDHKQLSCLEAGNQSRHHRQYMEPLPKIIKTLKAIASSDTTAGDLLYRLTSSIKEELEAAQNSLLQMFKHWKQVEISRLLCLANFLDECSLPLDYNHLCSEESSHSRCCLFLINFLYDCTKTASLNPSLLKVALIEELTASYRALLVKANNLKLVMLKLIEGNEYDFLLMGDKEVKLQVNTRTQSINPTKKKGLELQQQEPDTQEQHSRGPRYRKTNALEKQRQGNVREEGELKEQESNQSFSTNRLCSSKKKAPDIVDLEAQARLIQAHQLQQSDMKSQNFSLKTNKSHFLRKGHLITRRSHGKRQFPIEIHEKSSREEEFSERRLRKERSSARTQQGVSKQGEKTSDQVGCRGLVESVGEGQNNCEDGAPVRRSKRLEQLSRTKNSPFSHLYPEDQFFILNNSDIYSAKVYKKGSIEGREAGESVCTPETPLNQTGLRPDD